MRNPFYKSQVSKKLLPYIENQKRPELTRLILGLLFFVLLLALYSFHFEIKHLEILSRISMIDDTESLSLSEKRKLKDIAFAYYSDRNIQVKFHITNEILLLPKLESDTLYIAINPEKPDVLLKTPPILKSDSLFLSEELLLCLNTRSKQKTIGSCLINVLEKGLEKLSPQELPSPVNSVRQKLL